MPDPPPVIKSLQDERHKCPYCGTGVSFSHLYGKCRKCERPNSHYHMGIQRPKACGPRASFWSRLFRWCWIEEAHLHFECDYCGGNWISPPIGIQGEPILTKKPKKHYDRYHREKVI